MHFFYLFKVLYHLICSFPLIKLVLYICKSFHSTSQFGAISKFLNQADQFLTIPGTLFMSIQPSKHRTFSHWFLSFFHDHGHAKENPPEFVLAILTFCAFFTISLIHLFPSMCSIAQNLSLYSLQRQSSLQIFLAHDLNTNLQDRLAHAGLLCLN